MARAPEGVVGGGGVARGGVGVGGAGAFVGLDVSGVSPVKSSPKSGKGADVDGAKPGKGGKGGNGGKGADVDGATGPSPKKESTDSGDVFGDFVVGGVEKVGNPSGLGSVEQASDDSADGQSSVPPPEH